MPSTSWSTLRPLIARAWGYRSFNTTTDINADNTLISTELTMFYPSDDMLKNWFVAVEDGTAQPNAERRVTAYTASTGTLTSGNPAWADEGSNARVCAVYRHFPPTLLQTEFNNARRDLFPYIAQVRDIQAIVTGVSQTRYTVPSTIRRIDQVYIGNRLLAASFAENVLNNPGFEDWAADGSAPDSWAASGSGVAVAEESQTTSPLNYAVLEGGSSVKFSVTTSVSRLLQSVTPSVAVEGMEINFTVWVYCNTASRVSAEISGSDVVSTPVNGTAHGGTGWERLSVSANIDENGTSFSVGIAVTASTALVLYVDEAICTVGFSEALEGFWEPLSNWRHYEPLEGASNGGILELDFRLTSKQRIRLVGRDVLSSMTSDSSTVEVDNEVLQLLIAKTRQYLAENKSDEVVSEGEQERWRRRASRYERAADTMLALGVGMNLTPRRRLRMPISG
jgi:hypothetical protein